MVRITNNMKDFIEVQKGLLYVYGAGNNGCHVGDYLNRCKIEWNGYIDQKIYPKGTMFNEHPLFTKDEIIVKYGKDMRIRILITPVNYLNILEELLWLDYRYDIDVLCLVPIYENLIHHKECYNINKCLAYFRNKLFIGDVPTIICNDCTGGMIYNAMDMFMMSPTINVEIEPSDFLKICKNTEYYMSLEMDENSLSYVKGDFDFFDDLLLQGKVGDITIGFAHMRLKDEPAKRWNTMRKKINWNHIIYVMREPLIMNSSTPLRIKQEFLQLEGKKLFFSAKSSACCNEVFSFYTSTDFMFDGSTPIEKHFNLLEWINT